MTRTIFVMVIAISLMGIGACRSSPESNEIKRKVYPLVITDSICLPLDSSSHPNIKYSQYLRVDGQDLYSFWNSFNSSIYIYELEDRLLKRIITPWYEHGPISKIASYHIINLDSIILVPQYGTKFYLCDSSGEIYARKVNSDDLSELKISFWQTHSSPIIYDGVHIFLNNVISPMVRQDDSTMYLLLCLDKHTADLTYGIKHPVKILDHNFDISTFRLMNWTYDHNHTIYYSFNFDPSIYAFDINEFHSTEVPIVSPFQDLPPPAEKNMNSEQNWMHFQSNLSYSKILYDPFSGRMLRFILLPNLMDDMAFGEIDSELPKGALVEIFDSKFRYKGEIELGRRYAFKNSFFTPSYLLMQKITKSENKLCFDVFEL